MCEIEQAQSYCLPLCPPFINLSSKSIKIQQKANLTSSKKAGIDEVHLPCGENNAHHICKSQKSSAKMSSNRISSHLEGSILGSAVQNIHRQYYTLQSSSEHLKNKGTQTDYRESECQTLPWEPPYKIRDGHNPEVLALTQFTWGHGLPPGMHDMEIINRMRIKRAWEEILPPMDTPDNIKLRSTLVTALEADEWAFREAEIQFIINLRMNLAEKLMRSKDNEKKYKMEDRFKKLDEKLSERKQKEIKNIRNKFMRDLRKLSTKHRAVKTRLDKRDVIKAHINENADFYFSKQRYECSQTMIDKNLHNEKFLDESSKICEKLPKWLLSRNTYNFNVSKPSKQLCPRKVKRNEKKMAELCHNLEAIQANIELSETCTLLKHKQRTSSLPPTPRESAENTEKDINHSLNLLQSLVEASTQELSNSEQRNSEGSIEEIQIGRALGEYSDSSSEKLHMKFKQEENCETLHEKRVNEILEAVEGKTISKILTFLNNELTRLLDEKRTHSESLLEEKKAIENEIIQASKEYLETNRREELDGMFRQIIKVNEECAETYLDDIVKEGIESVSDQEAEKYITELADNIDAMTKFVEENTDKINEEGMMSDIVYNFLLPEVEKESHKGRACNNENKKLWTAQSAFCDVMILNMPDEELLSMENSSDCANSTENQSVYYKSESEEVIEVELASYGACNDKQFCENIIDRILFYGAITNEECKLEIRNILEQMLWDIQEKKK